MPIRKSTAKLEFYISIRLPIVPSAKRSLVADSAVKAAVGQSYTAYGVIDSLASLAHWWQPTDVEATGVSIGSSVATITPYVGTVSLQQPTNSLRALSTNAGLQFSGTNYYDAASINLGNAYGFALFAVATATAAGNFQSIFRFQNTGPTYVVFPWNSGSDTIRLIISTDRNISGPALLANQLNLGQHNILSAGWGQNVSSSFQTASNGIVRQTYDGANVTLPSDTLTVGRYPVSNNEYFTGTIKTLMIAKRQYSSTERSQIERFLNFYNNLAIFPS